MRGYRQKTMLVLTLVAGAWGLGGCGGDEEDPSLPGQLVHDDMPTARGVRAERVSSLPQEWLTTNQWHEGVRTGLLRPPFDQHPPITVRQPTDRANERSGRCDEPGCGCVDDKCQCPPGLTQCDGRCVDIHTDIDNCGTCGNTCHGQTCSDGFCAP